MIIFNKLSWKWCSQKGFCQNYLLSHWMKKNLKYNRYVSNYADRPVRLLNFNKNALTFSCLSHFLIQLSTSFGTINQKTKMRQKLRKLSLYEVWTQFFIILDLKTITLYHKNTHLHKIEEKEVILKNKKQIRDPVDKCIIRVIYRIAFSQSK